MNRRQALWLAVTAAAIAGAPVMPQRKTKSVSLCDFEAGPNAGGATITQIPNYEMW
jgi:hypothetical protein